MNRVLLVVAALVAGIASGCSSDGDGKDDGPDLADVDLSADTVATFVEQAAGDRLECLDVPGGDEAGDFTACLSDNAFSAHLYVFRDEEGAPQRIFIANDEGSYVGDNVTALRDTVLADLSDAEFEDAVAGDEVTPFDGGAVSGGDHVVVAVDEDAAAEPFPTLPTLDPAAIAAALNDNWEWGAQCEESGTSASCHGGGLDVSIDAVSGEGSPVTMTGQVSVTTEEHFFENVPEFLEAAGMPLTDDSLDALAACKPEQDPCKPRLVTETGLLVDLMANFQFTLVEVNGFAPMDS